MQNFEVQQVFIGRNDLFHDADGHTFIELFVLFDETVEGSMGAVLKNEIVVGWFIDDLIALHYVWVIQLLVDYDLFF